MKNRVMSLLALVPALALSMGAQAVEKKTATKAKPAAVVQKDAVAKKTAAKKRPAAKKAAVGAAAASAAVAAAPAREALTPAELAIAQNVYQGNISCELGMSVSVAKDTVNPGYFFVEGRGFKYHMAPVATTTGAVRLEDEKAEAMWLQVANKSMLINRKLGQRMADECRSAEQVQFAQASQASPAASLFEGNGR